MKDQKIAAPVLSAGIYFLVRTDGEGRAPLFDQMTKCGQNSSEFRKRFEGRDRLCIDWDVHFSFLISVPSDQLSRYGGGLEAGWVESGGFWSL